MNANAQVTLAGASSGNGTYAKLQLAIAAIPASQTGRNITITISANTSETVASSLTNKGWTSLTIKPASGTSPVVSGSFTTPLLTLSGTTNVTIDGSNNGTNSRNLTITNTNTGTSATAVTITGAASANVVKNSILKGCSTGASSSGVIVLSSLTGATNTSNTIENNEITKGATAPSNGVFISGFSATYPVTNNTIQKNLIYDFSQSGIRVQNFSTTNSFISNEITQVSVTSSLLSGIYVGNTISGDKYRANNIHDLVATYVYAFYLNSYTSTPLSIESNIINLKGSSSNIYGIYDFGSVNTSAYNVYYNTISISGDGGTISSCYYKRAIPIVQMKNNILVNSRTTVAGGAHYVLNFPYTIADPGGSFTSDYNDFYKGDAKNFAIWGNSTPQNYTEFKTVWTSDIHSKNVMPSFVSASNLHINTWVSSSISGGGTPVAGVTTDVDGNTRDASIPDIGADEFSETPSHHWVATTETDWATPGNWDKNSVPGAGNNVDIPEGKTVVITSSTETALCDSIFIGQGSSLTIAPGKALTVGGVVYNSGTLTVKADGTQQASLIQNSPDLTATIERSMQHGRWELVSSPVIGQKLYDFATSSSNDITTSTDLVYYGMRDYDEANNVWKLYFTESDLLTKGSFNMGEGYAVRRTSEAAAIAPNDNKVSFTGTLEVNPVSVALTRFDGKTGWCPVGNPYSAPIVLNSNAGTTNFLGYNAGILDPKYVAIYAWDEGSQLKYKVINHASAASYIPVGTAFFVRALVDAATVTFTPEMRTHAADITFRAPARRSASSAAEWTGFDLNTTTSLGTLNTTIKMNSAMTDSLDVAYDAGFLRMSSSYALYTQLVKSNGTTYAIQSITDTIGTRKIIPVGFDYTAGGVVTFSVSSFSLPGNVSCELEDRYLGTFHPLNSSSTYQVTLPANTTGTGRFYLHLINNLVTDIQPLEKSQISVVPTGYGTLNILGDVGHKAVANLFNANGVMINQFTLSNPTSNSVSIGALPPGIYMVIISSDNGRKVVKFKM